MPSYLTSDNENFSEQSSTPNIRHMIWQGLPGLYIGVADDGLYLSVDYGDNWSTMRPNTEFATNWPVGAEGKQLAYVVGPRECLPYGLIYGMGMDASQQAQIFRLVNDQWVLQGTHIGTSYPFNLQSGGGAETLLFGALNPVFGSLYRSLDGGATSARSDLPGGYSLTMLRRGIDGRLWAHGRLGSESRLFVSDDNGASWSQILDLAVFTAAPTAPVFALQVDPLNAQNVLVVHDDGDGSSASGSLVVTSTVNGGSSWNSWFVDADTAIAAGHAQVRWLRSGRIVLLWISTNTGGDGQSHLYRSFAPSVNQSWVGNKAEFGLGPTQPFSMITAQAQDDTLFMQSWLFDGANMLPFWFRSVDEGQTWDVFAAPSDLVHTVHFACGMVFDELSAALYCHMDDFVGGGRTYKIPQAKTAIGDVWHEPMIISGLQCNSLAVFENLTSI